MKRIAVIMMAIVMLLSLPGCGAEQQTDSTNQSISSESKNQPTVSNQESKNQPTVNGQGLEGSCDIPPELSGSYKNALNSLSNNIDSYDPQALCLAVSDTIASDYDAVELLEIFCDNNYYALLAILVDGTYYAVDPFNYLTGGETEWLSGFPGAVKQDPSLIPIAESLKTSYQYGGTVESVEYSTLHTKNNNNENAEDGTASSGDNAQSSMATGSDGAPQTSASVGYETETRSGTKCFKYAKAWIPVGTGYPKLSDDEIDELIASEDYKRIATEITTLADCINYWVRAGFKFGNGLIYNDHTTSSAWQTMKRRVGQCASLSSCMHYILLGDYDEVGYIHVEGHAMMYIKENGVYYAVNPVHYTDENVVKDVNASFDYYPETSIGSSSDFMDIAKGLTRDFNTDSVWTGVWDYLFPLSYNGDYGEYPAEYKCTVWIGPESVALDGMDLSDYANERFVPESNIAM